MKAYQARAKTLANNKTYKQIIESVDDAAAEGSFKTLFCGELDEAIIDTLLVDGFNLEFINGEKPTYQIGWTEKGTV